MCIYIHVYIYTVALKYRGMFKNFNINNSGIKKLPSKVNYSQKITALFLREGTTSLSLKGLHCI